VSPERFVYSLSTASALPYSAEILPGRGGFKKGTEIAKESGFEAVEAVALKGTKPETLNEAVVPVETTHVVYNWNIPPSVLGRVIFAGERYLKEAVLKKTDLSKPTFIDIAIFPPASEAERNLLKVTKQANVPLVVHFLDKLVEFHRPKEGIFCLLEPQPCLGVNLSPDEILALIQSHQAGLCLDTKHIRDKPLVGEKSKLQPWRNSLEKLLPYAQNMHIQPLSPQELKEMLTPYQYTTGHRPAAELTDMLGFIKKLYRGELLTFEINPLELARVTSLRVLVDPKLLIENLRRVRDFVKEALAKI
jgi:hypothetical protein